MRETKSKTLHEKNAVMVSEESLHVYCFQEEIMTQIPKKIKIKKNKGRSLIMAW